MHLTLPLAFALALALAHSAHAITFADGQTHIIDAVNSYPLEGVIVDDGPLGETTTVLLTSGGVVSEVAGNGIEAFGSSWIQVDGGETRDVILEDTAAAHISGGTTRNLLVRHASTATVDGGSLSSIQVFDDPGGEMTVIHMHGGVSGSLTTTGLYALMTDGLLLTDAACGEGSMDILGGTIDDDLISQGACTTTLFGGEVAGTLHVGGTSGLLIVYGGQLSGDIRVLSGGTLEIWGSGFNLPNGEVATTSGTITGVLADGTPVSLPFARTSDGIIRLLPEPSSAVLLCVGIAALLSARSRPRRGSPPSARR